MVDNGCLRLNEGAKVVERLKRQEGIDLHLVDASQMFMDQLKGKEDPEAKRKIIGKAFIDVFQEESARIKAEVDGEVEYLLQGTLFSDVIESLSHKGHGATIKSHHNVGGYVVLVSCDLLF